MKFLWVALVICPLTTFCGGSGGGDGGPMAPGSTPLPTVSIVVSPNPVQAVPVRATESTVTFAFPFTLTFRESAGVGGRIVRIVARTVVDETEGPSSTLDLDLSIPPSGTVSGDFIFEFDLDAPPNSIAWRVGAEGVDSRNRAFLTNAVTISISFVAPPVPSGRILLFGGPGHSVFLGCFSCSRFDSESVHNHFGRYGSRFSSTSIWNHFSQYGSEFSTHSACNEFASNPPILVDGSGGFFGELTLNTFRRDAITDPQVLQWLRVVVCEV
jgi:hypothetical protein